MISTLWLHAPRTRPAMMSGKDSGHTQPKVKGVQAHLVLWASRVCFLQIEGMTFHQQKDYDSLYCDTPEPN